VKTQPINKSVEELSPGLFFQAGAMPTLCELDVFQMRDVRKKAVSDHLPRMRVIVAVEHKDKNIDLRKCGWVNPFFLKSNHIVPRLSKANLVERWGCIVSRQLNKRCLQFWACSGLYGFPQLCSGIYVKRSAPDKGEAGNRVRVLGSVGESQHRSPGFANKSWFYICLKSAYKFFKIIDVTLNAQRLIAASSLPRLDGFELSRETLCECARTPSCSRSTVKDDDAGPIRSI
jgi:hypothetical protein